MQVGPISILLPSEAVLDHVDTHVESAKTRLRQLIKAGEIQSLADQILVYRITDTNRTYSGIVIGVAIEAFQSQSIVHHELTIPDNVEKQARIASEQGGFSKPIVLTHHAIATLHLVHLIHETMLA